MLHRPRHRRLSALLIIAVTNLGFSMLPIRLLNPEKAAILLSMLVAVVIAFLLSAFSHLIKVEKVMIKYVISGVLGIAVGAVLFFLLRDSTILSMEWVNSKGRILLIILNFAAALFLFFVKGTPKAQKTKKKEETPPETSPEASTSESPKSEPTEEDQDKSEEQSQ